VTEWKTGAANNVLDTGQGLKVDRKRMGLILAMMYSRPAQFSHLVPVQK